MLSRIVSISVRMVISTGVCKDVDFKFPNKRERIISIIILAVGVACDQGIPSNIIQLSDGVPRTAAWFQWIGCRDAAGVE